MERPTGPWILCFSAVDWDYLTMREHQLLLRLAPRFPVLYVEEQSHVLSLVRTPRKVRKFWQWARGPRKVAEHVWVYTAPMLLPFGRVFGLVNTLNQRVVTASVRRAASALQVARPILWLYEPDQYLQAGRYGERLVVYDCADKHTAFVRLQRAAVVREMETRLADRADVILTVSDALTAAMAPRRSYLVPNGTDFTRFRAALDSGTRIPGDLAALPRPVVGYVGTLDSRVDVDLLAATARALPSSTFVLIGPVQTDIAPLRSLGNVRIFGRRPYDDLPGYLKGFDVCLLPFRITDLTVSGSPIKLYDYLAAGRVVVSTDIPEARRFRRGVLIAHSAGEFIRAVADSAARRTDAEPISDAVRDESWDARAADIERILDAHLP